MTVPTTRRRWALNERFFIGRPGNPMMQRRRLLSTPWFGIYVHLIYREDLDPVPHDHPWAFRSLVLRGGYVEELHTRPGSLDGPTHLVERIAGRLHRFPLHHAHRIVSVRPDTVTLVVVGRKVRSWGFYDGAAFIDYRDALDIRPTEGVASTGKWRPQDHSENSAAEST
jgi:hypothetical protein